MSDFSKFLENGKKYARNPLGIIALFISLIYGFACLVLGAGATDLEPNQKSILIYFLVSFPFITLLSFLYLVTKHSCKLYGPGDYEDEENYLETLKFVERRMKNEKKVNLLLKEEVEKDKKVYAADLADEVKREVATTLEGIYNQDVDYPTIYSLKKRYQIFEELALNKVEEKLGVEVERHGGLENSSPVVRGFDGITIKDDKFVGIEVKYTRRDRLSKDMKESIIRIGARIDRLLKESVIEYGKKNKFTSNEVEFILIIVHECEDTVVMEEELDLLLEDFEVNASYRLFDIEELR